MTDRVCTHARACAHVCLCEIESVCVHRLIVVQKASLELFPPPPPPFWSPFLKVSPKRSCHLNWQILVICGCLLRTRLPPPPLAVFLGCSQGIPFFCGVGDAKVLPKPPLLPQRKRPKKRRTLEWPARSEVFLIHHLCFVMAVWFLSNPSVPSV